MDDKNSLERFLKAQATMYDVALKEISLGAKYSHWMWYIFPQLRGFGRSEFSYFYGLEDIDEARAYLAHPVLGARLIEISSALLPHTDKTAFQIMGPIDERKLKSCMTLFAYISEEGSVFHQVLDAFFGGKRDWRTIERLEKRS